MTAYVTSTSERLYTPLFRVIFREIRSLIPPKGTIVTIANIPRSRHTQGLDFEVPLKFLPRYVRMLHVRMLKYLFSILSKCSIFYIFIVHCGRKMQCVATIGPTKFHNI